jgi:hypothetical protein
MFRADGFPTIGPNVKVFCATAETQLKLGRSPPVSLAS